MPGRVEGKVALVTGAASGIGEACATLLAREGASVVVTDIRQEAGRGVADAISAAGGTADFLLLDVTDEAAWTTTIGDVRRRQGRLDILVNNAGFGIASAIVDFPLEDWRRQTAVVYDGPFLGMKHAIPLMREGGGGSIVNISSANAFLPVAMMPGYSAAKAALSNLTKSVAQQCGAARDGIRCNAVLPGMIDTPMHAPDRRGAAMAERAAANVPLGLKGEPIDVAYGVLWLASEEARYVTGAEIPIDGGFTTRFLPMPPAA
ncbi:MAG: SDR family oxidoreductase [Sphingomonadaceae bacterium]|nr:SDR family oxidoreductase [Sphingomonadaceae bacterium]